MSDAETKFANLQFRYTELLEKRIAQLEAAIASPVAPAATADADKKDDDSSDDEKVKKDVRKTSPSIEVAATIN